VFSLLYFESGTLKTCTPCMLNVIMESVDSDELFCRHVGDSEYGHKIMLRKAVGSIQLLFLFNLIPESIWM
jgi:hypothetical protein